MKNERIKLRISYQQAVKLLGKNVKFGMIGNFDYCWYVVREAKIIPIPAFKNFDRKRFNQIRKECFSASEIKPGQIFFKNREAYLFDENHQVFLLLFIEN